MADDYQALDNWIERLRELQASGLVREAMPELVAATDANFRASINAGMSPDGAAWPARKDGGRPLVNAAKALTVRAMGLTIVAVISGLEAIHHSGTGRMPPRRMIPTKNGLTSSLADSIKRGLTTRFRRKMGAR